MRLERPGNETREGLGMNLGTRREKRREECVAYQPLVQSRELSL